MRKLLALSTIVLVTSCVVPSTEKPRDLITFEKFAAAFVDSNKNWSQNSAIQDSVNKKFKAEVMEALKNGLLDDFPLELDEVREYEKGKFAASFSSHYIKKVIDYNSYAYEANFDIVAFIDKAAVDTLKEDSKYFVKGRFKKFMTSGYRDFFFGLPYTPLVGLTRGNFSKPEINLGIIVLDPKEIVHTTKTL